MNLSAAHLQRSLGHSPSLSEGKIPAIDWEIGTASLVPWATKGGLAILDQGLFSLANFLLNILLARWLEPAEYGTFAVAYSVFLLLGTFHTALLTEPMLVFGAGKYATCFREYLGFLLYGHCGVTATASLILAVSAGIFWQFGSVPVAQALLGLAIAGPFILLLWLLRRAFYVRFQPQWAATGGALYLFLMVAVMYGLYREQWLSPFSALVGMGAASAMVGLSLMGRLRPQWQLSKKNSAAATVLFDHWSYGRHAASVAGIIWVANSGYYILLQIMVGSEAVGVSRALLNLVMPLLLTQGALFQMCLPILAHHHDKGAVQRMRRSVVHLLSAILGISLLYASVLIVFRRSILFFLYEDTYSRYAEMLYLVAAVPLFNALASGMSVAFRATAKVKKIFLPGLAGAAFTVTIGTLLVHMFGILGAFIGISMSWLVIAVFLSKLFFSSTNLT